MGEPPEDQSEEDLVSHIVKCNCRTVYLQVVLHCSMCQVLASTRACFEWYLGWYVAPELIFEMVCAIGTATTTDTNPS